MTVRRTRESRVAGTMSVMAMAVLLCACPSGGESQRTAAGGVDTTGVPAFDADAAHALLRRQVEFGPRVPGTAGHAAQLEWMTSYLKERADTVTLMPFEHVVNGRTLAMTNVFAQFAPAQRDRVLLLAHWDTRPTADMDDERPDEPIPGANDGASGVAVLLQIADVLARHAPQIGVDILLVDGEDYGPGDANMYLGAKYFAANRPAGYNPLYGILLDMVGDAQPVFPIEGNSQQMAPEVIERVWRVAERVGLGHIFVRRPGPAILDDHLPLNRAGIRTIDIIDFDYGPGNQYWHTHQDDVQNTSPEGLGAVGRVLLTLIWNRG